MSGRRDSNPQLSVWKTDALPIELLPQVLLLLEFNFVILTLQCLSNNACQSNKNKHQLFALRDSSSRIEPREEAITSTNYFRPIFLVL